MATLSDVVDQYLVNRRASGKAKNTLNNDTRYTRLLLASAGNIQTRNLRPQHVDLFWSKHLDWQPSTKNVVRAVLMNFFKWCQARGHIARDMDLMPEGRRFKEPVKKRVIIPPEEFEEFLDGAASGRSRITLAVGLYLFTRQSETAGLRWRDLNFASHTVEVFRWKTQTLDILPLCEELEHELKRWRLEYAATMGEQPHPDWFVVPALTRGKHLTAKGTKGWVGHEDGELIPEQQANLAHVLSTELKRAGYYREQEGGHTLRRSGAVALYGQLSSVGHDRAIRVCQAMLGHANISTTEIYLRLDLDRKVRNDLLAGKPMFPRGKVAPVVPIAGLGVVNGQADSRELRV